MRRASRELPAAANLAIALERSCHRHASAPAIVAPAGTWTYADLADRAGAVATTLRAAGLAGARDAPPVVAVVLDRSAEFVAAILGILAADAVYLPLDPSSPAAYLGHVFTQAQPAAVVTDTEGARRLAGRTAATILTFPQDLAAARPGQPTDPAESELRTDPVGLRDPAYVIYTSGSTGTPKGVVVPHEAVLNSTAARIDRYGPAGRVPLLHSPAFDLTSGVLFWAVLSGGTLVIDPRPLSDVAATLDLIHRHDVSHLIYPASLYGTFLDRAAGDPPTALVAVGIGSERWSPVLIDRHARLLPNTLLVNEYGPTEACVCASYAVVYDGASAQSAPVTIGGPVRNTGYLLVDDAGRPTSGLRGELAITGVNLALGYLNRPDLTEQRFLVMPDGQRAYRTGDLVERTPFGDFVFLDRLDRQLQIGGHRVEPGHIETALLGHPRIAEAYVAGRRGPAGAGPTTLIAYLVPRGAVDDPATPRQPAAEEDLPGLCDRYLRERLPAYLVPVAYVVLPELPRTPAGKIDHPRLPAPGTTPDVVTDAGTVGALEQEAELGPLADQLAGSAADILGVPSVAVDASLAGLGAGSLSLIRLAAVIATEHDVEVPISHLFRAGTIARIAALVRAARASGAATPATSRPQLLPSASTRDVDSVLEEGGHERVFPLSGQQQQVWVLTQMAPDSLAYSTQFSLLLSGPLDVEALEAALTHVVARHEILRTTFHDHPRGPGQVVQDAWSARVELIDLSHLAGAAQDQELRARLRSAVRAGFDVTELPLVRWHLFRLGPTSWRLLQVEHHFAHDGWSAQLFLAEIRDAYRAIIAGELPRLVDLPVQYGDYAAWYQAWRGSDDFADQLDYWRTQLEGCPAAGVTFTPDRTPPRVQSFRGDRLIGRITPESLERLDELAAAHGVSRFAVFLSAFALQVWQHTREQDLVIGSALANRRQPGTDSLLGMFVNALPLRLAVDPDAGVADLLQATMATLLGAQDHQELPLLDLLAHLGLPRDPARTPLFSLMFAFHDTPRPHFQVGPLRGEVVIEHNGTAKNHLNVVCVPDPPAAHRSAHHSAAAAGSRPGMSILWEYDSDLFDAGTAQALLSGFEGILTLLPQAPPGRIRDLDLLGEPETARILAAGTGPEVAVPFAALHEGFEAAAEANPDAVALEHADARCTYRDLELHAGRLQRQLSRLGVRPGAVVAVVCSPGVELVAALVATLRLGAVYVCLDPVQPAARTKLLLHDAGAVVVVTTHRTVADAAVDLPAAAPGIPLLFADEPQADLDSTAAAAIVPATSDVDPDDPAYLVYTSGSTGTPKAVITTHRNACAAVHARTRYLQGAGTGTEAAPRTLITLPATFDVAPSMIFWTLWSGGTIVLPHTPQHAGDPEQIQALVERHAVTHVNFVASFYRQLLHVLPPGWGPSLTVVAIGGEACEPDDVRRHAALLPDVALDNEYGPTEATVWCSAGRLHPRRGGDEAQRVNADDLGALRITAGRPLANTVLAVMAPDGALLPAGAAGELYIGGAGVAAGYHRRPDLTGQRFVTPHDGPLRGRRLYRSGDRARLVDGEFQILGRLDDQVKIRGFRVELGEVSAVLREHPDVTDALVALEGEGAAARLVAYVATDRLVPDLTNPSGLPEPSELPALLRAWIAGRLPAYMTPARYVVADELPRTATGKIDRDRLRTARQEPDAPAPVAAPVTARQEQLLHLWCDQLQQPGLGIDDDFFASGGDSLQAIRVVAQARGLGIDVTLSHLMSAPTVRALDRLLQEYDPTPGVVAPDCPLVQAAVGERRPAGTRLRLSPIQAWFFEQRFADPDHFLQTRLFDLDQDCDEQLLRAALAWTLERHDAFRTLFSATGPGGSWEPILSDLPPTHLIGEETLPPGEPADEAERLADVLERRVRSLSLHSGPLADVVVVTGPNTGRRWLHVAVHHLIVDAVSWQVLLDDVETAYRCLSTGTPPPARPASQLPPAGSALPDVPCDPARAAEHWSGLAAAVKPTLRRTGTGGPSAPVAGRIQLARPLSAHAGRYLRHDVHRLHGIGAYPLILAALWQALTPWRDGLGLYVWLEGHGRNLPESDRLESVVGWLTVLYPALLCPTEEPGGRLIDAAAEIAEQLEAVPDGGAGFGHARHLQPDSALGRRLTGMATPPITVNYLGHDQPHPAGRVLRPSGDAPGPAIDASNVLPTPIDLTVGPDPHGAISLRLSIDPTFLAPGDADHLLQRLAGALESAARLVPLTTTAPTAPTASTAVIPPARTLYLVHPVGGSIEPYAPLARALGPGWNCYGLPHAAGDGPHTVPDLAAAYLARFRRDGPPGPYLLLGWSFGAVVAYEMARQVDVQLDVQDDITGDRLEGVVLLDPPAARQQPEPGRDLIAHLHALLPDQPAPELSELLAATSDLPTQVRAGVLGSRLGSDRASSGAVWEIGALTDKLQTILECHAAMSTWQPGGQVARLSLILPADAGTPSDQVAATWRPRSRGDLRTVTTPGDHRSMLTGPGLRSLVALLTADVPDDARAH